MLDNNQWLGLGIIAGIAYLVDKDYRGGKEYGAESFSAPYPRKKGEYYNRCHECDGDIMEDQYQIETTYTRHYCVDSKRGKSTCGMDEEWEDSEESYAESFEAFDKDGNVIMDEAYYNWSQPCDMCDGGTLTQEGDENDLWVIISCDSCGFSQDVKMKEAESFEAEGECNNCGERTTNKSTVERIKKYMNEIQITDDEKNDRLCDECFEEYIGSIRNYWSAESFGAEVRGHTLYPHNDCEVCGENFNKLIICDGCAYQVCDTDAKDNMVEFDGSKKGLRKKAHYCKECNSKNAESFGVDVIHRKDGREVWSDEANEYECGECESIYDNASDATICCKCPLCANPIHDGECIKYAESFEAEYSYYQRHKAFNRFLKNMEESGVFDDGRIDKYEDLCEKYELQGMSEEECMFQALKDMGLYEEMMEDVNVDAFLENYKAESFEAPYSGVACSKCGEKTNRGDWFNGGSSWACQPCQEKMKKENKGGECLLCRWREATEGEYERVVCEECATYRTGRGQEQGYTETDCGSCGNYLTATALMRCGECGESMCGECPGDTQDCVGCAE